MLKNVLRILTGNASGQIIQMVSLFILATMYNASEFGKLGHIQAITTIAVVILTLQLQHVIPISDSLQQAMTKTKTIIQIVGINSLVFLLISFFISKEYVIASIYAFILALPPIFNNLLVFKSKFSILSHTYIVRAFLIVALQFVFYYSKIANGLLLAAMVGELLALIYILFLNKFWNLIYINIDLKKIKNLCLEWKSFALYGTLQECLSVMVYSIPVILYVNKFGENIGGQFSMAFKVTFAPIVLISSSLAQVLTQKFGRENDFSILKKVVWFDKRFLVLIVFILFLPFVFANSGLNIMNRKWDVSIQIIPYLLLNSFFFLFANPFRIALRILKRNADILKIEIGTVVALGLVFSLLDVNVIMLTICMTTITFFQNMFLILAYFSQKKSKAN